VGVAVGKHRLGRIEGAAALFGEIQRHFGGPLFARAAKLDEQGFDELGEAGRLFRAGHENDPVRRRPPGLDQGRADGLDLGVDGKAELGQLWAEPLQQHGVARPIMAEDLDIAAPAGGCQDAQLAAVQVASGNTHLQHRLAAVGRQNLDDESLGAAGQAATEGQAPVARQAAEQVVETIQPGLAPLAFVEGLQADELGDLKGQARFISASRSAR